MKTSGALLARTTSKAAFRKAKSNGAAQPRRTAPTRKDDVPPALAASSTPVVDVGSSDGARRLPAGHTTDIAVRHALDRVLQQVGRANIGVAGRESSVVADWLRQTGRNAVALTPPGQSVTRSRVGTRAGKHAVIVAVECLEYAADPVAFLRELKRMLAPEGRIVVVVPNIRHASVRLAMLLGHYTLSTNGSHVARRPFTATEIEAVLEEAGFSVTAVERKIDPVDVLKDIGASVPEAVLGVLAADADALTSYFIVLGTLHRSPAIAQLNRRVNEIASEQRAATLRVEQLAQRIDALEARALEQRDAKSQADTTRVLTAITQIEEELRSTTERLSAQAAGDAERDAALRQARESLIAGVGQITALTTQIERARYRRLVPRLLQSVSKTVPKGAIVAVISRGDNDLLAFDRRKGWHFPQTDDGVYAGHHPADDKAAITHLEQLRARGARYLLIPRTAFWWLEYYKEFNEHLLRRYRCVLRDEHTCALFYLRRGRESK
jgi:SAM-dependent methyltransferase